MNAIPLRKLLLLATLLSAAPLHAQSTADVYQQALRKERTDGDLAGAIKLYEQVARGADRALAARAVLRIGEAYEQLGRKEAVSAYRRLVRDYADQADVVKLARVRLAALEIPAASVKSSGALAVKLIWEGPRIDVEGRPTPDGRYLSFVDWYGTGDLSFRDLATGEVKAITTEGDGNDVYPLLSSMSQDGKRIAFFWNPPDNRSWRPQLKVANIDGTGARLLIENADRSINYLEPSDWTPDGKHVLVQLELQNDTNQIALVSTDDGSIRVLASVRSRRAMRTTLSPDGKWAAYDVQPDVRVRARDIFIVAADGSGVYQMQHPANDLHPIFSPDGDYLFFSSDRDGSVGLWAVRMVNGRPQGEPLLVKGNLAHSFYPMGFAQDVLFYAQDVGGGNIFTVDFNNDAVRVNGTPKKLIEQYQGYNTAGYWSADGRTFAYASRRLNISLGQWGRTYVRDIATGQDKELTAAPAVHKWFGRPRPSPDGRYVVTLGDLRMKRGLHLIDTQTGERRTLDTFVEPTYAVGNAEWSHDGRAVYYGARSGVRDSMRIVVIRQDIATGEKTEVVQNIQVNVWGTIRNAVSISPDGRNVAYGGSDKEGNFRIYTAPLNGGPHHHVLTIKPPHSIDASFQGGLTWTPDGKHILFAQAIERDRHEDVELFAVPVAGGAARSTGLVMPSLRHVSFAPDGRLTFTAGPIEYKEIWTMENLLTRLTSK